MIHLTNLTKKFEDKIALNNISLHIHPGAVTGFLGPNGAGKTTTMRVILGLISPTSGNVLIDGKPYTSLKHPLSKIGAMVDAGIADTRLTPKQHLTILATAAGIDVKRVNKLLSLVGLEGASNKRISEFSFGMKQRVHIAGALIGDPETVMMDEPFNGLDVEGIHWLRTLLRDLAKQGKAVLVSSHLLSEVQEIADRVIVLARGELIADMSMEEMRQKSFGSYVQVQSNKISELSKLLKKSGAGVTMPKFNILHVTNITARRIGDVAFANGISIYELAEHHPSLKQLFSELVDGKTDYKGINITQESEASLK